MWTKSKPEFTALDRCDRCGARASMRATLPAGVLLFCSHHTRDHHAKLVELGALIEVA